MANIWQSAEGTFDQRETARRAYAEEDPMASRSTTRSRCLQALAAAVLTVSPVAACGEEDGTSSTPAAAAGNAPGSPLVDGIAVPPGTTLLGGVFAHRVPAQDLPTGPEGVEGVTEPPGSMSGVAPPADPPSSGPGMSVGAPASSTPAYLETEALLVITGDPVEAFASLVEQAEAAGFEMRTIAVDEDEPAFCTVSEAVDPGDAGEYVPLGGDVPDGELALSCNATATPDFVGGRQRELMIDLFVSERDDPFHSFAMVTHRAYDPDGATITPDPWDRGLYQPAPVPDGPSPVTPPELPDAGRPGDPLTADWEWGYDGAEYEVLEGSRQPVPGMPVTSGTGGFVTVVEVTGDLDTMVDRYYDEITDNAISDDQSFEHDGAEMRYVSCDCGGGGGSFTISAIQRPGEPGYLLLERHTD
jgi:hypothetical protein